MRTRKQPSEPKPADHPDERPEPMPPTGRILEVGVGLAPCPAELPLDSDSQLAEKSLETILAENRGRCPGVNDLLTVLKRHRKEENGRPMDLRLDMDGQTIYTDAGAAALGTLLETAFRRARETTARPATDPGATPEVVDRVSVTLTRAAVGGQPLHRLPILPDPAPPLRRSP